MKIIDSKADPLSVLDGGLFHLLLTLLIASIGFYHMAICIRTLLGRRVSPTAGLHAILLFSGPCLLALSVAAVLPTTFPDLFVFGIDADAAFKHTLRFTSFLGWLCFYIFIPSFFLSLLALNLNDREKRKKRGQL